jgi:c(7)-type cytochrome triheme protein
MKQCLVALIAFSLIQTVAAYGATKAETLNGSGILYTIPVKSVLFTHKSHGIEQRLSCVQCHNGLFEMEALKVQEKKDFNMESFYQGKYCGACHNGKDAFASNTQCARCHLRVKGMGPQRDIPDYKAPESFGQAKKEVRFNHEIHTRLTKCSNCHPGLFKIKKGANKITQADHGQKKYCFVCHDGKKSFSWNNCSSCHVKTPTPRQAVLFGHGEKAILFSHQTHAGKLKCGSCHTRIFPFKRGDTKISFASHSSEKACFTCHKEKNGVAFYNDCSRCHKDRGGAAAAQQGPGPLIYKVQGAGPVNFNHTSHTAFTCDQCHPKLFSMKKGGSKMTMADMYQGKSCGACHDGKKAFPSMACAQCHKNQ